MCTALHSWRSDDTAQVLQRHRSGETAHLPKSHRSGGSSAAAPAHLPFPPVAGWMPRQLQPKSVLRGYTVQVSDGCGYARVGAHQRRHKHSAICSGPSEYRVAQHHASIHDGLHATAPQALTAATPPRPLRAPPRPPPRGGGAACAPRAPPRPGDCCGADTGAGPRGGAVADGDPTAPPRPPRGAPRRAPRAAPPRAGLAVDAVAPGPLGRTEELNASSPKAALAVMTALKLAAVASSTSASSSMTAATPVMTAASRSAESSADSVVPGSTAGRMEDTLADVAAAAEGPSDSGVGPATATDVAGGALPVAEAVVCAVALSTSGAGFRKEEDGGDAGVEPVTGSMCCGTAEDTG